MPVSPPTDGADRTRAIEAAAAAIRAGRGEGVVEALAPYRDDESIDILVLCGLAHALEGETGLACELMVEAARRQTEALHPLCDLAPLILEPNALARAEAIYRAVLERTPNEPRAWHALSLYMMQAFRFDEAVGAARRSIELDGGTAVTLNQLGISVSAAGDLEGAVRVFEDSAQRWPDNFAAFSNIACSEAALGRFDSALEAYRRAIALSPSQAQLRLNHAICLLKAGRMAQGWAEYEWRLQMPGHTDLPAAGMLPSLSSDTRLDGRTILVTHEEGLGDTLQFLRFVPALAAYGARVVVAVPEPLRSLAGRVEGVADAIDSDAASVRYDWHCPFMSLPRALAATPDRSGAPVPYLHPDPALTRRWAEQLPPSDTLRVGLVWAGASRAHLHWAVAVDRRRSVSLAQLSGLADLRGISFVSLQLGPPADQLFDPPEGLRIHDAMDGARTMDDTAALIAGLDVVVSVDTSVAHLAGGLGKPVFLLDRFDNCWRWGHGSETTDLYPAMRIFRQPVPDDWSTPIAQMIDALREMAEAGGYAKPRERRRSGVRPARRRA